MSVEKQKKNLQCGSCTNLLRDKVFEARCNDLGKLPSSKSCGSYIPDAFSLVPGEKKINNLLDIAHLMSTLSPNELQILAGLMLREKMTRRAGFSFLQKVYVRVQGSGNQFYLNDFVVGYVLDADRDRVRIISESGVTCITAINDSKSLTLYTTERFAPMRVEMMAKRHFTNPKNVKAPVDKYADTIAELDKVDPALLSAKRAVRKSEPDDLTAFAKKLGRGLFREKRTSTPFGSTEISISHE